MLKFKWFKFLVGGIVIFIIGISVTVQAVMADLAKKSESNSSKYEFIEELSSDELSDNMPITGYVSRVVGKYAFDFGDEYNVYFVTALPATEGTDSIKYISINPFLPKINDPYSWWNERLEQWTEYFENGTDPQEQAKYMISCKLHKISEDSLTEAYQACGSYVKEGDILPYCAEPYIFDYSSYDYRGQTGKTDQYPIGIGIAALVIGAGMITGCIIHFIKTKKAY